MKIFHRIAVACLPVIVFIAFSPGCSRSGNTSSQDSLAAASRQWFTVKLVAENVWRIDDHGDDNMYLVAGKDSALLIDAGTGVADLSACIRSITSLPLIVVNTHGHPDHCGSDYQFAQVYAHPADFELIDRFCNEKFHMDAVRQAETKSPEMKPFLLKEIPGFAPPKLVPIKEGFVFHLGGRILEVIEAPCHTKGGVCLLDSKNMMLFTGDNNNTLVWLFLEGCPPLETYLTSLRHLRQRSKEFAIMLPGHGDPIDKGFLDEQTICAQKIVGGETQGEPYKTFVENARIYTYKRAAIAFDPNNIHVRK